MELVRVKRHARSGVVSVTWQSASPTSDALSAFAFLDENTRGGRSPRPLLMKHLLGSTYIATDSAWVVKYPEYDVADDPSPVEWMIACHDLGVFLGGSVA